MGDTNTRAQLECGLGLVNEWLRFAEAKNGATVGVCLAVAFGVSRVLPPDFWADWGLAQVYIAALVGQILLSSIIGVTSFLPVTDVGRLLPRGEKLEADNLLFFGDLAKYSPDHLLNEMAKRAGSGGDEVGRFERDLAGQVITNARIAGWKFWCSKWSIRLLLSAMLTPILLWSAISFAKARD